MKGDDFYFLSLTNPKGEVKAFTYQGWQDYKSQVTKFGPFITWCKQRGLWGTYLHFGKQRVNDRVVEEFLTSQGYSWVFDGTLVF